MVKKILIVLFFAIMLLGVAVYESGLKSTPQLILIVLGVFTSLGIWFKIKSAQHFLMNLLVFVGSYAALFMLNTGFLDLFYPDRGSVIVDGESFKVMDWSWVNSLIFGIIGAVVAVLFYHYKFKKHAESFEFYFALGFAGLSTVVWGVVEFMV